MRTGGVTQEQVDAAADGTGPRCGLARTVGGSRFVCVRVPHDAGHVHMDGTRRRQGKVVASDRHYFVRANG